MCERECVCVYACKWARGKIEDGMFLFTLLVGVVLVGEEGERVEEEGIVRARQGDAQWWCCVCLCRCLCVCVCVCICWS